MEENLRTAIIDYIGDNAYLKSGNTIEGLAEGLEDYLAELGWVIIDKVSLDQLIDSQQ